jgi:hypothetical protein
MKAINEYDEAGYCFPIKVYEGSETMMFREAFLDFRAQHEDELKQLPPGDQFFVFAETHTFLPWVYRMVSSPKVLDAVERVLGLNLMVWDTRWFAKLPGEKTFVGWHQDATYWGLHPPNVVTAWIALTESVAENGCLRVIPGTHRGCLLPQRETYAPDSGLSRGQEISVAVDEAQAVDILLQPGEMSLHHIGLVHGSRANQSQRPRIGIAVRYITPEVIHEGAEKHFALLVRGRDEFGHFELLNQPLQGSVRAGCALQMECLRRLMGGTLPGRRTVAGSLAPRV